MPTFSSNYRGPTFNPGDTVRCPMGGDSFTVVRCFPQIGQTDVRPIKGGRVQSFKSAFLARVNRETTPIEKVTKR
jgi:hypothetical protein